MTINDGQHAEAITGSASGSGTKPGWEEIAAGKRKALQDSIPAEWRIPPDLLPPESQADVTDWPEASGWFTPEELAITNCAALELLSKVASGHWKSLDVTKAFCKRASAAHQLVNCLSDTCFERAFATAHALDDHLAKTGKTIGPLHGLPISLKDNFYLKGLDATVGFVSHVGDPASYDSTLAEVLQAAGAVFYVKTNVPTAMMIAESVNNTFGRTTNPKNRRLTSGGSSGGESALLLFKGSPLGIGTDIGGSLRIPAACTGIFTLRPSLGRFPTLRCRSGMPGQEAVASVNGPMARTLADMTYYSAVVTNAQPWLRDPKCLPIPWREAPLPPRLRVGVMRHDGMVLPTPPVSRAIDHVARHLRAAGHDVVEWDVSDGLQARGVRLLERMFVADGGQAIRHEVERGGEPWRPEMRAYEVATELGTRDMWRLHLERTEFQKEYLDKWNRAGIDVILCPTMPFSAVESGKFKHVGYTGVFNVLDYSAVSFPTGLYVDAATDAALGDKHRPLSEDCAAIHGEYNPAAVHGMPISLQLVARRLEEEKVLAVTKVVLDLLH